VKSKLSKKQLARALGISPAAFTKYVQRGCPLGSISEALDWQRRHIDPTQRLLRHAGRMPAADPVELVHALARLAEVDFLQHGEALRRALRSVPAGARSGVELPMDLWRQLLPPRLNEVLPPDPAGVLAQTVDDAEAAGLAVYMLCSGELRVNP
jgi:hypothetical protein